MKFDLSFVGIYEVCRFQFFIPTISRSQSQPLRRSDPPVVLGTASPTADGASVQPLQRPASHVHGPHLGVSY